MLISASWHVLPWCLHGMLVTCFGRKNWRIEHSKVLYTPVSQPCSKRPVWVPFPLNANELLRAQPKDGICTAHFFPPAEDVRTASCYYGNTWVWGRNGCRTTNCGATLYVRAGVSVGRLWVFFAGVSVSRLCVCALLGWVLWLSGGGGVLSNWWCSLVGRRCSETWGSVHPTTEQECLAFGLYIVAGRLSCYYGNTCLAFGLYIVAVRLSCYYGNTCLAFGLYIVAVRLSCTSEARATQWRILVQVAELVWAEIPGARAGISRPVTSQSGWNPNSSLTDPFFDFADYKTLT